MPQEDIPHYEETLREPSEISSLSSGSSGRISRVYSFSSQNAGSDSDSSRELLHQMIPQNRYEEEIENEVLHSSIALAYDPIVIPAEPSLEELLVRFCCA